METEKIQSGVYVNLHDESESIPKDFIGAFKPNISGGLFKQGSFVFRFRVASNGSCIMAGNFFPNFFFDDVTGKMFYSDEGKDEFPPVSEVVLREDGVVLLGGV